MTPRFEAIGMVVADMATSLRFYRAIGLDIPADADAQTHAECTVAGGIRVMWDTAEEIHKFDPDWRRPQGGSAMTPAFACAGPAEVDETVASLEEAGYGVHRRPFDAFWGQRYATVVDPDGNDVDLFAPL